MEPSERIFQDQVKHLAKSMGWVVFHSVPFQVRPGQWRSDGKGFPDLIMAHRQRGFIAAELKAKDGRLTAEQLDWGNNLQPWVEYYVWRPRDLQAIAKRLGTAPQLAPVIPMKGTDNEQH